MTREPWEPAVPFSSRQILDAVMGPNDAEATTIRDYLKELLKALWQEGDGFSGKRPFGNSGWEFDVYRALVAAGLVPGTLDDDGDLDEFSDEARSNAYYMIREAIEALE